jgi:hypothetical protein
MWTRIILGIVLALAAYFVVRFFSSEQFTNWDSVIETPAYAPPIREPIPRGEMSVSAGGPNPPNVAAPANMPATLGSAPEASDPYSETAEDADAPENLRHPERSFSPGIIPETGAIAVAGGIASAETASSPQAFQTFSPEFVQNGGSFFGTVSAFEDENPNYTAF